MKKNYIGVLDSGLGGLSVLKELHSLMPNQNFIYFGDTKNVPYGTKSPNEIYNLTKAILDFFVSKDIKYVVFACNTTSAVAYDELKEHFKNQLTIFPLIQSVAKSAQENIEDNKTIAILATKATINSKKYETEIHKYNPAIKTIGIDCTGFVEIVENNLYKEETSRELIKSKLDLAKDADRIILGCTHYPYLTPIFRNIISKDYFNPANCLANIVKKETNYQPTNQKSEIKFYTSSNPKAFKDGAKNFFKIKNKVKLINL